MAGNIEIKNANGKNITLQNPDTNNSDIVVDLSDVASRVDLILATDDFIGVPFPFPTTVVPTGFIEYNGATISRTVYAKLFARLGTTYGIGDGSTTFQLPDLRGEFIRGWDNGRGIDSGRTISSWQVDLFKSHNHSATVQSNDSPSSYFADGAAGSGSRTAYTDYTGGTETRPRNIAMMYCAKY